MIVRDGRGRREKKRERPHLTTELLHLLYKSIQELKKKYNGTLPHRWAFYMCSLAPAQEWLPMQSWLWPGRQILVLTRRTAALETNGCAFASPVDPTTR